MASTRWLLVAGVVWVMLLVPISAVRSQQRPAVDLLLVLAIDCSDSVMSWEFRHQTDGIAQSFMSPEVLDAIKSGPGKRIAVLVVQWAGATVQRAATPWRLIETEADALAFGREIAASNRGEINGGTSISGAIDFAVAQLALSPFRSPRHVIDVSGDGQNSDGRPPEEARDRAVGQGIVINGLAILSDVPSLDRYYEGYVIGGPASFVMAARDFADYRDAIRQKLIREILSPLS